MLRALLMRVPQRNRLIARSSSQGRVLVLASGVMVVEVGGRPLHKKWLMRAQVYKMKESQFVRIQGCE